MTAQFESLQPSFNQMISLYRA